MRTVLVRVTVPDSVTDEQILAGVDGEALDEAQDVRVLRRPAILVIGSPTIGFEFVGPFESEEEAAESETALCAEEWWATELVSLTQPDLAPLPDVLAGRYEPEF